MSRIQDRFTALQAQNKAAFIPFIMAGDPDAQTSLDLLKALPAAGADLIEIGMCFTDPMADGATIQAAGLRALDAGQTLVKTLDMIRQFRQEDNTTPLILMGYYNPVYVFGVEAFLQATQSAGVDGLIIVDLPTEEDAELCLPARAAGVDFIRLATPTTDDTRLPHILKNASGFVYYVSVAGVTGAKTGDPAAIATAVQRIRTSADLPVAVGFGVKTPENAVRMAKIADAVVVGSALVSQIESASNEKLTPQEMNARILDSVRALADAIHHAREGV